ncbi:YhjD/YihY/BrkB family envelope integrity protein [Saliphagus infecundisoli]|uniref:YhjD/YihY/BrkB family envelope integrity protein n=1 Tax=Saliphagus infecundisoli TaxID=1849069 RepID=A0ABD5Q910_9EURY|nr:YhjD/YihY/BrkB family envelope integrity protein [Saliphagus infecundisoli]
MDRQSAISQAKLVKSVFSEKNVTFLAGSIAYSAFVSLVPLIMFVLLVVSFGAPDLQQDVIEVTTDSVSPSVGGVIEVMIEQQSGAGAGSTITASIIGVLTLVWGALKVFRGIDTAFSEIYETVAHDSFTGQIKKGLLMLLTLTLGIVAMVAATSVVALFSFIPFIGAVVPLLLVVGLIVAFFPMYYLFPDIDVEPRDVLPGTLVGAIGWAVLQVLFQVYVSLSGDSSNLIASILLLVTWLYFSGVVLLLGAVVNAVVIDRASDIVRTPVEPTLLDSEMSRDELAAYLQQLQTDLTGHSGEIGQPDETMVGPRATPRESISVTEGVRDGEEETTHEVRLRWHSERSIQQSEET